MNTQYYRHYSSCLHRDMEYKSYGKAGKALLVFPSQSGRFYGFENNGMLDAIRGFIEDGKVQVYCVDSNDDYSFSQQNADPRQRIEAQESYFLYITTELLSVLPAMPLAVGCSMGAYHALNMSLRRPDLFSGAIRGV